MKKVLMITSLLLSMNVFAKISNHDSDKGNGGSTMETLSFLHQRNFENAGLMIKKFFINNKNELQPKFPEFKIKDLIDAITANQIKVVDENLFNEYGNRTGCMNDPSKSEIICQLSYLDRKSTYAEDTISNALHVYLKVLGLERDVDETNNNVQDFLITRRILPYIAKTSSGSIATGSRGLDKIEKTMFTETLTVDLGINKNPTDSIIKNSALAKIQTRCTAQKKKMIFSDAHILNKANGSVLVRFVCD